jgi:hypothetical protein
MITWRLMTPRRCVRPSRAAVRSLRDSGKHAMTAVRANRPPLAEPKAISQAGPSRYGGPRPCHIIDAPVWRGWRTWYRRVQRGVCIGCPWRWLRCTAGEWTEIGTTRRVHDRSGGWYQPARPPPVVPVSPGHASRRAGSGLPLCRQLRVGCRGGDLFVHPRRPCCNRRQLGSSQLPSPAGCAAGAGGGSTSCHTGGAGSPRTAGGPSSSAISVSSPTGRQRAQRVNTASPPSSASTSPTISHPMRLP